MMIVKPNDPNLRGRISCSEIERNLREMLEECEEHPESMLRQAPRQREYEPILPEAVEADILESAVVELSMKDLRVHNGVTHRRVNSLVSGLVL